ncbi:MAG: YhcN/YlaJ family sporulation lipoprotein [Bacillales bacterium]|nr:YhcN/YlaJ family sporulation lipoprotein [Bacillales bacterium]
MVKKIYQSLVSGVMVVLSLAACSGGEDAYGGDRPNYHPKGVFSNEGHGGDTNDRHDGPMTELYDHSIGKEGQAIREHKRRYLQVRDENGNPPNPTVPLAKDDKNFWARDNQFSRKEINYHGHLQTQLPETKNSYYHAYEGKLAEKLAARAANVNHVQDARAVIYGKDVIIAVIPENGSAKEKVKSSVKKAVQPYVNGRRCTVVTGIGNFGRVRNIDNELRDGGPKDQIELDLKEMVRTLRHQER